MRKYQLIIFWVFFSAMPVARLCAQENHIPQETFTSFDSLIGLENTGLFNGKQYLEQHITRNELHKYFLSERFIEGSVVYDGQPYFSVPMKFNIYDDLLLVQLKSADWQITLQLHKEKIEGFEVLGHPFIHLRLDNEEDSELEGFYEVLLENSDFRLLKKHRKKRKKLLDKQFAYYEFERDEAEYFFEFKSSVQEIRSRRSLMDQFPELKKEIRQYYNRNKSQRKSNPDRFYSGLFQELTTMYKGANTSEG